MIKNLKQKMSSYTLAPYLLLALLLLNACSPEAFPDCCGAQDDRRDAPFSTTYIFQYKTGTTDIVAPNDQRLLRIISEADILTLINSASTSQLNVNGLIGGLIQGFEGPVREAAFQVTDRQGNVVSQSQGEDRNLFYNSLGRVPDFLVDSGTGDEGTFTLFNAPPGELFFELTKGGRGNGRITSFSSEVSLGRIDVLPVFPDKIGVLGVVTDVSGQNDISDSKISFFGKIETASGNGDGLFIVPLEEGLATQGEVLVRLSAPSFGPWETVHHFESPMERITGRQQAFDPITIDNLSFYSQNHLQELAAAAGVPLDTSEQTSWSVIVGRVRSEDGTGQGRAIVKPLDKNGDPLDTKDGQRRVFYFNAGTGLDPSRTETSDDSRYIVFIDNCDANQEVFLHSYSLSVTLPVGVSTGRTASFCEPGKVFSRDIVQKSKFIDELIAQDDTPVVTVLLEGDVKTEVGDLVPGAAIEILGSTPPLSPIIATGGSYTVNPGLPGEISPILANGDYTIKTSLSGNPYLPTYQEVSIGASEGAQDLILLQSTLQDTHCPSPGTMNMMGTVRDLGLLDASRQGRAISGISLKVLQEDGTEVGRVVYIDGNTATSNQGQFVVCDLPGPGLYQVQVTSEEDSGAKLVQNYGDGVTRFSMTVNGALPKTVHLSGKVQSFAGPETGPEIIPIDSAQIKVQGTQLLFNADALGNFNFDLGSNSKFIVQVEKEGYLRTDNYQVESPAQIENAPISPLWTLSHGELDAMAGQADVDISPQNGILAGKVVVRGLESNGSKVGEGNANPIRFIASFFDEDRHLDVLSISGNGTLTLFTGDGTGALIKKSPACPDLPISPQSIEQADLNLDGFPDLVAISGTSLFVFTGNREGCFEQTEEIPATMLTGNPQAFHLVDLTGDDFIDILVATDASAPLERFNNRRNGSFIPPEEEGNTDPVPSPAIKMEGNCGADPVAVFARLSATGALIDIVIADTVVGVCEITYNADEGALPTKKLVLPEPMTPTGLKEFRSTFLDADATPDILVLHEAGGAFFVGLPPSDVTITDIPLETSFLLSGNFVSSTATFVDLNRDNRNDLLIGGADGLSLLLGNGDATFGASAPVSSSATSAFTLSDFNEDGKTDVIALQGLDLIRFFGEDSPKAGISVEVRDSMGTIIGSPIYFSETGQIQVGAQETSASGRFIIFNVPPGEAFTNVTAGGAGNSRVTVFPDALAHLHLNMTDAMPTKVKVEGQIINPTAGELAGIAVDDIKITAFGTGVRVLSSTIPADPTIPDDVDKEGAYKMELGATSEFIIQLDP